jgi:NADH-quinone oxidoreductase subunit C
MAEITEEKLQARFGGKTAHSLYAFDEFTVIIDKNDLIDIVLYLRDDPELRYRHLSDITVADYPDRKKRFDLVYHLYSFELKKYIRLKVRLAENESIETLTGEWDTADWLEREVYDMFGITFKGHPDLRRILMWPEFEGHPLRRDYPLTYEMPHFSYNKDNPPEVIK